MIKFKIVFNVYEQIDELLWYWESSGIYGHYETFKPVPLYDEISDILRCELYD